MKTNPSILLLFVLSAAVQAQDPFEIHIYEYEPMPRGSYSVEAHLNLNAQGRNTADDLLLPTRHQSHFTVEPTVGLSPQFAIGVMLLNAWQPGHDPQFAGWRILPHFYAPQSWRLPVKVGLVAEFSFQNTRYEENSRRIELRPIVEREFGEFTVVFNPVVERALHGPGTRRGWNLEPALLARWRRPVFSPSIEYYGGISSINVRPRGQPQVHQLFAGGDWRLSEPLMLNLGVGFDVSGRGPGVVLKSRFEWRFGKDHGP